MKINKKSGIPAGNLLIYSLVNKYGTMSLVVRSIGTLAASKISGFSLGYTSFLPTLYCLSAGCSLLRAEGFFCNLDVLYGGLGIGKLYFLTVLRIRIRKDPKRLAGSGSDPEPK
jgi:hypothetical protein